MSWKSDETRGRSEGWAPRGPMDPRPVTAPEIEVSHEAGAYSVVMPFSGRLDELRHRADCWSLRLWREGDDPSFAEEIPFPTAVDPTALLVRLNHGVLEFLVADIDVVYKAFEDVPADAPLVDDA